MDKLARRSKGKSQRYPREERIDATADTILAAATGELGDEYANNVDLKRSMGYPDSGSLSSIMGEAVRSLWAAGKPVCDIGRYKLCESAGEVRSTIVAYLRYARYYEMRAASLREWAERVGGDGGSIGVDVSRPYAPRIFEIDRAAMGTREGGAESVWRRAQAMYDVLEEKARCRLAAITARDVVLSVRVRGCHITTAQLTGTVRFLAEHGVPVAGYEPKFGYYLAKLGGEALFEADRLEQIAMWQRKRCELLLNAWKISQGMMAPPPRATRKHTVPWGWVDEVGGGSMSEWDASERELDRLKATLTTVLQAQATGVDRAMTSDELIAELARHDVTATAAEVRFAVERLIMGRAPIGWVLDKGFFYMQSRDDLKAAQEDFVAFQRRLGKVIYAQREAFRAYEERRAK